MNTDTIGPKSLAIAVGIIAIVLLSALTGGKPTTTQQATVATTSEGDAEYISRLDREAFAKAAREQSEPKDRFGRCVFYAWKSFKARTGDTYSDSDLMGHARKYCTENPGG